MFKKYEDKIISAYETGVSLEEAERLATEFLHAQLQVSRALKAADLDARMRRSGMKALKAAVYLEGAKKGDKKPSDVMLNAEVDAHEVVQQQQDEFDKAEVERDELERLYNVFREGHIHFRGVSRGRME